ncbi:MAG: toll/interleukin-1 receptor domain-containing protein [Gammaproteobacteria bacterium]|nr:toll/interleukin-1 receptor domain-containing protein [Gammaproteobacteria bacterium]MDH3448204.1 toll/interleukin-1 receptor domain-containing protein [Gammaproteobacteria bacterium]
MRVFISHAWEDKPLALELAKLPDFVHAWVDIQELSGGQVLDPTIITAIEDSHVFIVLVSRISVAKDWVAKEIEWALDREAQKDRVFVLPVVIDSDLDLTMCPPPFAQFANQLFIDASDRSEDGIAASRSAIASTLFRWASDWLERLEPKGDSNRRFAEQLERDLLEYQKRLFAIKAVLAWPLTTLVEDDAVAHLITVKDSYNEFTDDFIPRLAGLDAELRWRFGVAAVRAFTQLATFIRNDVFHGAAYALNDVIESINAYDSELSANAEALAAAEARRETRVAALEPVMAELVNRTANYIDTLKP